MSGRPSSGPLSICASSCSTTSTSPRFAHAAIAMLYVSVVGLRLSAAMSSRTLSARRESPLRSHASSSAATCATSALSPDASISSSRRCASSMRPRMAHALITIAYRPASGARSAAIICPRTLTAFSASPARTQTGKAARSRAAGQREARFKTGRRRARTATAAEHDRRERERCTKPRSSLPLKQCAQNVYRPCCAALPPAWAAAHPQRRDCG